MVLDGVALHMDMMPNCSEILLRTETCTCGFFPKFKLLLVSQTFVSPALYIRYLGFIVIEKLCL